MKKGSAKESLPSAAAKPTFADIAYGPHERNKLDFWKADSDTPTPIVVFIHGGGFVSGDKGQASKDKIRTDCLAAKVSYASINYRYRTTAPIQDVLRDCARAVQFLRSKSTEWNIDKSRVGCYGGSAGAGTSMWLAFHDDLADPNNADPILRESTRISCAASNSGQFSYDIVKWVDAFGKENADRFGDLQKPNEFYGLKNMDELTQPVGEKIRADCDMCGLISKDDPPVFLLVHDPAIRSTTKELTCIIRSIRRSSTTDVRKSAQLPSPTSRDSTSDRQRRTAIAHRIFFQAFASRNALRIAGHAFTGVDASVALCHFSV